MTIIRAVPATNFKTLHAQISPDPVVELNRRLQMWASVPDADGGALSPSAAIVPDETITAALAEIASLRAQLETVRGALRADDERLRAAGMRSDCYFGCDTPDAMAEKIAALTAQLDEARRKAIEEAAQRAEEFLGMKFGWEESAIMVANDIRTLIAGSTK